MGCKDTVEQRSRYWDSIKGFLIVLVVLGHYLKNCNSGISEGICAWAYSFHMPLFMFVSGLFTNIHKSWTKLLLGIIETFCVFTAILIICPFNFHLSNFPYGASWYLFVLIIYRALSKLYIERVSSKLSPIIIVSIVCGLLINFLPQSRLLSIDRCFYFAPFFFAGMVMRDKSLQIEQLMANNKGYWYGLIVFLLLIVSCIVPFKEDVFRLFEAKYPASSFTIPASVFFVFRVVGYIYSIILCLLVAKSISKSPLLDALGRSSMGIYVWHYVILCLLKIIDKQNLLFNSIYITLFVSVCVVVICYYFSKTKLSQFMLNPISIIAKKINKL